MTPLRLAVVVAYATVARIERVRMDNAAPAESNGRKRAGLGTDSTSEMRSRREENSIASMRIRATSWEMEVANAAPATLREGMSAMSRMTLSVFATSATRKGVLRSLKPRKTPVRTKVERANGAAMARKRR